ncbi:hypothetical protein [Engelhardtia mirabilis]|uniref:DUF1761 domain-containing protein n=1 Tax=Engelhardtia mirabilis TaxID=2528011 RepID=A0A518BQ30_9BACT|nr:hypothetical protein Pla133_42010 [Planctomycetes bacterium Pla133]QDV03412.1 hypothetical protein Pla86_42000 [Planctomycetes bacterium Pla86]
MDFLTELWLPILLAAVLVFVYSSISHMVIQFHKKDYDGIPNEEAAIASLRAAKLPPGNYVTPWCDSMKEMGTPEFMAKWKEGPVAFLVVRPNGPPNMGVFLGSWFAYCIVVAAVVAYITRLGLDPGADYLKVFQLAGAVTFVAYGMSSVPESIWKGQRWSTTLRFAIDGLVYALLSGGVFGWLWPSATGIVAG